MKILITGAGGMLGSDLAAALSGHFQVVGIVRRPAPYLTVPYEQADLISDTSARRCFEKHKPELVFHTAAMTNVDGCELDPIKAVRDNERATESVVEACNAVKAGLVFFSTDYVFDGEKPEPYTENDKPAPRSIYGETKANAENYIRRHAVRYWIFRVSWLYGLRGKSFPRTILEKARTEQKFRIVADQTGAPTWTKDIAQSFRTLLEKRRIQFETSANQIFNLANEGAVSWADFASYLLREAGFSEARVEKITTEALNRPAKRPKNSRLQLTKTKECLGMSLRPWSEAAKEFIIEWKRESA